MSASKSSILRCLNSVSFIASQKMKKKPILTRQKADRRLKWAKEKVGWGKKLEKTIYSYEKNFNMDGSDGWCRYWRDFRNDEKHLCRRHAGSGGVMVWATFSNFGQVGLTFCSLKMDQDEYIQALDYYIGLLLDYYIEHNDGTRKFHPSIEVTELNSFCRKT